MLDDHEAAAKATYRAAQGASLSKEQLRAGIIRHLATLQAERTSQLALHPVPRAAFTFLNYFDQWIAEEEQKVSVRTGRKLSRDTIWTHRAVRKELVDYAAHSRQPLSFEGLTKAFYDGLRNYMLGVASRSPRTSTPLNACDPFCSGPKASTCPCRPALAKCFAWSRATWARMH